MLHRSIPLSVGRVVTRLVEHSIGNVVLAGAVRLYDSGHHALGHLSIVGQQLLRILGEAVTTVAKRGVVVVRTDTGVKTYTRDDGLGIESLHLSVCIELIEVRDAQGQVGVGKELHGLGLFQSHKEHSVRSLLQGKRTVRVELVGNLRTLDEERRKGLGVAFRFGVTDSTNGGILFVPLLILFSRELLGIAYDDAAGIEVILQCLRLAQELGREEQVEVLALEGRIGKELESILHIERAAVAHGNGGFNHHHGIGVDTQHQVNDIFDMVRIEEVLLRVVVGRCSNHHKVGILISLCPIQGSA